MGHLDPGRVPLPKKNGGPHSKRGKDPEEFDLTHTEYQWEEQRRYEKDMVAFGRRISERAAEIEEETGKSHRDALIDASHELEDEAPDLLDYDID